jgi:formate hydrogenlyase transcriptional activator
LNFEKFFESSPDAIVVANTEGQMIRVNARAEELFGYVRHELLGQSVDMLVPERFRNSHAVHRSGFHAQPRSRPMGAGLQLYARKKTGEEVPVDIMLNPIETGGGLLVMTVIRDITDRKRMEDALRSSEERFRLLVETARDYAIFMLDVDGRVTSWNPGAERINGFTTEEVIGQHCSILFPPEELELGRPEEEMRVAAVEGRSEDEGWRLRKDGTRFWANVITTAVKDEAGNLRGFAKIVRDITEKKKAQEALLLEVAGTLISNLDIQQLLTAIALSLKRVAAHDYASLALLDSDTGQLYVQPLDSTPDSDIAPSETVIDPADSPEGWALRTRKPVTIGQLESARFASGLIPYLSSAKMQSACWMPLISHDRILGTLNFASRRANAFDEETLQRLSQVASQVALAIDNALAFRRIAELQDRLKQEKEYLEDELRVEHNFDEMIGESRGLKRVLNQVETVASTDATVLILGETGTGKELIARAIHDLSSRRERTFVRINCAAIPAGLLESELFGHEKGAFTGAIAQRTGRMELADHGTLFLDEVGDIPLELQPKLLRALQDKEIERVGGNRTIPVDVRLIAATNRNLDQMVREKQFRSDLYYRLRVFPMTVPPLRERPDDIPILVRYFTERHAKRMSRHIETIPPETMEALSRWRWPGNVRELENFIERAVILSPGPVLRAPLAELQASAQPLPPNNMTLEAVEREHIKRVLHETGGVISGPDGAAARLGINRTTLNSRIRKLGISRKGV